MYEEQENNITWGKKLFTVEKSHRKSTKKSDCDTEKPDVSI